MAYFECITGSASSGDGVALIVECDSNFAGSVITADNGEDIFTENCPSVSPYTVRFEGIPTGTYTISGVSQGQTFTTQFTVLDYETTLNATPDGATVTPTNDVQTWLHCAEIWNKNYTTINQVLSDTTTLLTLISSNNAVDYMARSTSWASSVCANQTAMGYIGNNNYCADKLLSNSTWRTAICNSTYFESVLNVKVPTMTSNTAPSGQCFADSENGSDRAYKAFNGDTADRGWWSGDISKSSGLYVGYKFPMAHKICKARYYGSSQYKRLYAFKYQGSNDGNTYTDISGVISTNSGNLLDITTIMNVINSYQYIRLISTQQNDVINFGVPELQFWGR